MINNEKFISRLQKVLDYYSLSASAFADKIGVQRSSISHILSGRNKPSLDFVMRILNEFPDVELYWLLNGKGSFPKEESTIKVDTTKSSSPVDLFSTTNIVKTEPTVQENTSIDLSSTEKKTDIARIVIFYKDGTFESFEN
ncbi:helix-turn-helix domain-containing protein [Zhouia sp. PK063]|uniref:helix-turn-helix domain-containing protein n=1 Tax=Zhouia sp. PK063 TaxID=3373602 RepID=UPI003795965B